MALIVLNGQIVSTERFNPHHDKLGRFASGDGLTSTQYEALRPAGDFYDHGVQFNAKYELESSQQGKDIIHIADEFQASQSGVASIQSNTYMVLAGRSLKDRPGWPPKLAVDEERRVHSLLDAARNTPPDLIPPTLHRGIALRNSDLEEFKAAHIKGALVELGPSSFTSERWVARHFAENDENGRNRVFIDFDTSRGAQALPIQNLSVPDAFPMKEFIVMGRFEVTSNGVTRDARGEYHLTLTQVGAY